MIAPGSRVLHGVCSFILIAALLCFGKAEFAMELVAHPFKLEPKRGAFQSRAQASDECHCR